MNLWEYPRQMVAGKKMVHARMGGFNLAVHGTKLFALASPCNGAGPYVAPIEMIDLADESAGWSNTGAKVNTSTLNSYIISDGPHVFIIGGSLCSDDVPTQLVHYYNADDPTADAEELPNGQLQG